MSAQQRGSGTSNEKELIARSREGDKTAYRTLVEAYQDRVFSLVLSMVRQRESAEDLTQEVFVKAFFALPKFAGDSAFYTWIFRIASNHCLDHLSKRRVTEISLDATVDEGEESTRLQQLEAPVSEHPESLMDTQTETGNVLATLTADQQMILSLRELEGYSYEELAEVMNCGVNTIKSRLNRAREAFKLAYEQRYGRRDSSPGSFQGETGNNSFPNPVENRGESVT